MVEPKDEETAHILQIPEEKKMISIMFVHEKFKEYS